MPSTKPVTLEVLCHECRAPIPSIPAWLIGAKVKFQCEECRQKHPKAAGEAEPEPRRVAPDEPEPDDEHVDEEAEVAEVEEAGAPADEAGDLPVADEE
ncbi:MAG: hypothetical protein FJX72_10825 [Armatimonadetes bacterium]|nr:hypothetical protein [Armatimonadota bacterium]